MDKNKAQTLIGALKTSLENSMTDDCAVSIGRATYSPIDGTLTVKVTLVEKTSPDAPAYTSTPMYRSLLSYMESGMLKQDGVTADTLDKVLSSPSLGDIRLVGYNPRASKYPYVVQCVKDNKRYKLSTHSMRVITTILQAQAATA